MAKIVKPTKYIDRISGAPETSTNEENTFVDERAFIKVQTAVLQQKEKVAAFKRNLEKVKNDRDFDPAKIVHEQNNLELAERTLKQLEELQKELF